MATYPSMFLLIIALLMFVAATPLAMGDAQGVEDITFGGRLSCATPHSPMTITAGVNVSLTCGADRTGIAQARTDPAGVFRVVVKGADSLLFDEENCYITIRLPDQRCRVYLPNGTLQDLVKLFEIAKAGLGPLAGYPAALFRALP